jgi:hypothetical protein
MNIPPSIIPLMNCVIVVKQVKIPSFVSMERKVPTRKFVRISELDTTGGLHDIFSWTPSVDAFQQNLEQSYLLAKIAKNLDVPTSVVMQDLQKRKQILLKMVEKNLRDFRSVHKALTNSLNLPAPINSEATKEEN